LEEATRRYLGGVRLCYANALRTNPNLAGRVAVVLAIAPDGAVVSAERDAKHTTLPSDAAVTCVLDLIRSVSFPAAQRATQTDACVDLDFDP
jgi:hypothetical protein